MRLFPRSTRPVLSAAAALAALVTAAVWGDENTPFDSAPIPIPGRVQAENYDLGGEGVAYHDSDSLNNGNGKLNLRFDDPEASFRREEGVDLSYTKAPREKFAGDRTVDGGKVALGSLYVGWGQPGEWIRYTVEVERAGRYRISGRVSAGKENAKLGVEFGGNGAKQTLTLPHTGSAHVWTTARNLGEIELTSGVQTLTLRIGEVGGFNIDWLRFSPVPATAARLEPIDFNREIRPILADNCYECHGPDEHGRKGDLRLDLATEAYESAIVPGNSKDSPFVERLLTHDEDDRMPPPESPRQPTSEQIRKLVRWIDEGANYDEHWSFVAPVRPEVPEVSDPDWPRNEIDGFVLALLDEKSLTPRPDARPGVLARRLSLTLTGLPATPRQLTSFERAYREDPDKAINDWVDQLLASPAFGEHFAWSWMDAGRYADTNGYQADGPRVMWPWRDWLIRALNANTPFDELTEQLLAGDLMIDHDWESAAWISDAKQNELLLATGFLRNHRYDTGSGTIPAESNFENAADRLETVGTVWMGLTLQCARCHSHKFDPIEQREYYQLLDFFDNVPEVGSALKHASHPYIHTPTNEQRAELLRLTAEAEKAETAFRDAAAGLDSAQADWERDPDDSIRVRRGLRHRFAAEGLSFDGKKQIEKSNDPVQLCAGDKEWTISFWFKAEGEEEGAIFSSVEEPERYRPGIQADWADGKIRVRHVCRWVNSYIEFESVEQLEPGRWHHVTFRCDGRMQGLAYRASLDGSDAAMVCTHPVTNDSAENAGKAPLLLGGSPLMAGFVGELRDLRFYDREVSPDEVTSLADSRSTVEIAANQTGPDAETLRLAFLESEALPAEVAKLRDRVFETRAALKTAIQATPTTMVMKETDRGPTFLHPTGGYDTQTEVVSAATPAFLNELSARQPDRREFARWLTSPENPLTARVAVNRIWQLLWGRGFVDSPENFGTQCAEPIHSELLDWLATEYIRLDWDTKALIKLIATSRTYRQNSAAPEELWAGDPQNRLLARGPRFRLPIQTVRDQALVLSGRLDITIGGPPVLLDEVKGKDEKPQKLPYEFSDARRTIYSFWKRNGAHPMLAVFDVADRNQCDVRTRRTNTPLQALVTLNEPGLAACARDFAQRARKTGGKTEAEQLRWAWRACTGTPPTKREASRMSWTLNKYRDAANGDEDVAWTALANVLLNLDATLSVE